MRIAVICDVLGVANNGTTVAALNQIEALRMRGHEVTVVCGDESRRGQEGFVILKNRSFGPLEPILRANGVEGLARPDRRILTEVIAAVDVVHVELPFKLGHTAATVARALGKPVTASFHAQAENFSAHLGLINARLINRALYRYYDRRLYRYAAAIHYPSQFICDEFERAIGRRTPAFVISNGVNQEFFADRERAHGSTDGRFRILCSGRYSAEKAQHVLIRAVSRSCHKDGISVFFAGTGPKERKLKRLAKRLGVTAEFAFLSREQLRDRICASDLYVHTANIEIEAIACTEAIVSGLVPVICNSARSATRAFALDGHNLFHPGDAGDLAQKIDFWYENRALLDGYRERYVSMIPTFDQSGCMDRLEQMIVSAVAR